MTPEHHLQSALAWAEAGWNVFPCKPNKAPYTATGFKAATRDAMQIRAWWSQTPHAMIGLPTGQRNLIVIDTDVDETRTGEDSLTRLPPLPETLTVRTPSGGMHRYYYTDQPIRNSGSKIAPLVDTRCHGGYVIAPPSMNTEGQYTVVTKAKIAQLPATWELLCLNKTETPEDTARKAVSRPPNEPTPPGEDFAQRTSWSEILTPLGWKHDRHANDKDYWTRPGKQEGTSATTFGEDGPFYCHSSNADLPALTGMSKFAVYAYAHHAGNYSEAARELRSKGFGAQSEWPRHQPPQPNQPQDPQLDTADYWTISSLRAYTPDTTRYLAGEGFIRIGAATALIGGTGVGKSVLAMQTAVCMATKRDILDTIEIKRPVKTAVIQAEDDEDTTKRNLVSIADALSVDAEMLQNNLRIYHRVGLDPSGLAALARSIHASYPFEMLIVDNYQSYLGASDINSTEAFFSWRLHMETAIKDLRCGLLILAHPTKPKVDSKSALHAREGVYSAAGTSAFANWVRASMELVLLKDEDDRVALRFSKNAERTGCTDIDGKMQRQLLLQRASQIRPHWSLATDQQPPMTPTEKHIYDEIRTRDISTQKRKQIAELLETSEASLTRFAKKFPRIALQYKLTSSEW